MMDKQIDLQHFILTRFNLQLWNRDKKGCSVRTIEWLEHRFGLFESYCLPSLTKQTCENFEWIVLFDSNTPERYKDKINTFKMECPQMIPVFVEPNEGRYFADIFKREVVRRLSAKRVITSYLDNDDALNVEYVGDLQQRVMGLSNGTFINYTDGFIIRGIIL